MMDFYYVFDLWFFVVDLQMKGRNFEKVEKVREFSCNIGCLYCKLERNAVKISGETYNDYVRSHRHYYYWPLSDVYFYYLRCLSINFIIKKECVSQIHILFNLCIILSFI